jgi:hypothetical protein
MLLLLLRDGGAGCTLACAPHSSIREGIGGRASVRARDLHHGSAPPYLSKMISGARHARTFCAVIHSSSVTPWRKHRRAGVRRCRPAGFLSAPGPRCAIRLDSGLSMSTEFRVGPPCAPPRLPTFAHLSGPGAPVPFSPRLTLRLVPNIVGTLGLHAERGGRRGRLSGRLWMASRSFSALMFLSVFYV